MSLSALAAELLTLETVALDAAHQASVLLDTARAALTAVIPNHQVPEALRPRGLDIGPDEDDRHSGRALLRRELREMSVAHLLAVAGTTFGLPGSPVRIDESTVREAMGYGEHRREPRALLPLDALVAHLERTYGGAVGLTLADRQLKTAVRGIVRDLSRTGRGVVIELYAWSEANFSGTGHRYSYAARAALAEAGTLLTRALTRLGVDPATHALGRVLASREFDRDIVSREVTPAGPGYSVQWFLKAVRVTIPTAVGVELADWLAAPDLEAAA